MKLNNNKYNLLDCQKGSVIVTFAAFLLLALPAIGLFITYGFGVVARTNVQGAMDSAALAASLDKNPATRTETARRYYDANYKAGFLGSVASFGTDVTANIGPVNGASTLDTQDTAMVKTPLSSAFLKSKNPASDDLNDGRIYLTSHVRITGDLANNPADPNADMVIVLNTSDYANDISLPNKDSIGRDTALKLVLGAFIGNALENPATTRLKIGAANNSRYRLLSKNRNDFVGNGFTFGEQADGSYKYYSDDNGFIGKQATNSNGCLACGLAGAVEMMGLVVPQNSFLSGGTAIRDNLKLYRHDISPFTAGGDKYYCMANNIPTPVISPFPTRKVNCLVDFPSNAALLNPINYTSGQACTGDRICNTTPIDWRANNQLDNIVGESTWYEVHQVIDHVEDVPPVNYYVWRYFPGDASFLGSANILGYAGYPNAMANSLRALPSGANNNKVVVLIVDKEPNRTIDGAQNAAGLQNSDWVAATEMLDMCKKLKDGGVRIYPVGLGRNFDTVNYTFSKAINFNGQLISNFRQALTYCSTDNKYTQINSTDQLYDFLWQRAGGLPSELTITK